MENETADAPALSDTSPFAEGIIPGTMSGAEMLEFYEREGAFRDYPDIGPGRKYANSTEYLLAMREEAARRGRETE